MRGKLKKNLNNQKTQNNQTPTPWAKAHLNWIEAKCKTVLCLNTSKF